MHSKRRARTDGGGRRAAALAIACAAGAQLAACAASPSLREARASPFEDRTPGQARPRAYNRPYVVRGRRYVPAGAPGYDETGVASWYGYESGRRTSNGEAFTLEGLTAAHRTLPIPSLLEVTNLATGARVVVRLNDRGPFVEGRLIDLSHEAARRLGELQAGSARVRVRYLGPAPPRAPVTYAVAAPPLPRPGAQPLEALQLVADLPDAPPPPGEEAERGGAVVQAAAFADRTRAQAAADRLAQAGPCRVEPPPSDGAGAAALYRVMLRGGRGEGGRLRAAAAALGFPDARVLVD